MAKSTSTRNGPSSGWPLTKCSSGMFIGVSRPGSACWAVGRWFLFTRISERKTMRRILSGTGPPTGFVSEGRIWGQIGLLQMPGDKCAAQRLEREARCGDSGQRAAWVASQLVDQVFARDRFVEQIALPHVAAVATQKGQLLGGFDAFGDDRQLEVVRHG